jgi:hypothetical protein
MNGIILESKANKSLNSTGPVILDRRKIRLKEGNAKCRHLKKLPLKDFAAVVYLSEAQNPVTPPPTHCIRVYSISHREGGRGETREKVRWLEKQQLTSKLGN